MGKSLLVGIVGRPSSCCLASAYPEPVMVPYTRCGITKSQPGASICTDSNDQALLALVVVPKLWKRHLEI
jgi:hypothetical protein